MCREKAKALPESASGIVISLAVAGRAEATAVADEEASTLMGRGWSGVRIGFEGVEAAEAAEWMEELEVEEEATALVETGV